MEKLRMEKPKQDNEMEKFRMKQVKEETDTMMMDVSTLSSVQQEYIHQHQMEILEKEGLVIILLYSSTLLFCMIKRAL